MHRSAYEQMQLCVATYLPTGRRVDVVDLGSRVSDGQKLTHRSLLEGYDVAYTGVDVRPGANVDRVMTAPYRLPVRSSSADVVLSGQAFEHIPFFWASMLEITRVLKPGGLAFVTAPSRGHVHDAQDCWRYYPDGFRALAAYCRSTCARRTPTSRPSRASGTPTAPSTPSTPTGATPSASSRNPATTPA
ncbi:methyltransferase domain-containing protein [Actinomadura keratinilytica]